MKVNRSFPRKNIGFDASFDVTISLQQIEIDKLHTGAPFSELPSNKSIMILSTNWKRQGCRLQNYTHVFVMQIMAFVLDGNSEHVAHRIKENRSLRRKKKYDL